MNLNKKSISLIIADLTLFLIVFFLFLFTPFADFYDFIIRFAALIGFTSMFLATIMTPFMVELYQIFGKPFIKLHHLYSILGLVLITIHPLSFAILALDITVFIPIFYPWIDFWSLAGRPALILIYLAIIAALLRKKLPKNWRYLHFLNYVALFFGYVHGVLIGTDFQNLGILIIFTLMIVLSLSAFGLKRYQTYKRRKLSKTSYSS
jgi:DMSO/TMAO reductase YedYZ heme-binding membrane subunit